MRYQKPCDCVPGPDSASMMCGHGNMVTHTEMEMDARLRKLGWKSLSHPTDVTKFQQIQAVKAALGNLNWHSIVGPNGECECASDLNGNAKLCGDDLVERIMTLVDNCREYERISNGIQCSSVQ